LTAAYAAGLIEASSDPALHAECADSPQPVMAMPLHGMDPHSIGAFEKTCHARA
jgi:hypothetical protein